VGPRPAAPPAPAARPARDTRPPGRPRTRTHRRTASRPFPARPACPGSLNNTATSTKGTDMIEVHQLTKRYGAAVAVDGLSFTVRPGRVTGFLGPNGAGKSTTMRVILGLDAPTAGWATVSGRPYQRLTRPLHQAGALLDAGALHGGRTARDHLLAIAASNGIGARRVGEVLGLAGLEDVNGRRVRGFSLGMKQRLRIPGGLP